MRRFVPASTQPAPKSRKQNKTRAMIEAMEARTLLSVAPQVIIPPNPSGSPFVGADDEIEGQVYQDNNVNGILDGSDVRLANQTVYIDVNNDGKPETGIDEITSTDASGFYFLLVPPGTWNVRVVQAPGLVVENTPGTQPISVTDGQIFSGADFGEYPAASISGSVFSDVNGNGVQDPGEVGVSDRVVFADVNNDGVLDGPDIAAVTDVAGNFTIQGLPQGTFSVRVQVPPGSVQTSPASGSYQFTVTSGQAASGAVFGLTGPDLSSALVQAPPALVIGGVQQKVVRVNVTNVGSVPITQLVGVTLYMAPTTTFDPLTDNIVGRLLGKHTKLKAGQSKVLKVAFRVPTNVGTGSYHLMAQVISSEPDANPANDVSVAPTATTVMQPFVDLGIAYSPQPLAQFNYGRSGFVVVTVTNHGNVVYDGFLKLEVIASPTQTIDVNSGTQISHTIDMHVKLAPQKSRAFVIPVVFTGLAKGWYYLISTVDPAATVGDFDPANNAVVSLLQTQIL